MNEQASNPLVSIIVPIYNVEQYLVECLDSLVGQTYDNVEILAIDDGSTDSSYAVLKEYAARHRQVRAFHQENAGAAVARNWGVDEAKGKYVCFVDPDDALELNTVEEMVKVAEELQTDVVMTCLARYDSELKELLKVDLHFPQVEKLPPVFSGEDIATKIYSTFRNGPSPCNKFIRRQFIVEHGLKFQALPRVNDLCFAYATLAFARRIHVINKAYYKYRTSRKGSSQNSTDKDPTPVCSAYHRLKEVLSEAGKFDVFAKSFYMAFYGSCSYTFRQLKNICVAERLLKLLRSESMADITDARLTRDDFRTDAQFAAYQSFWRQRDAVQLMLDDETKKRLAADAAPRVAGSPSKTLGFICGSLRPGGIERVIVRLIPLFAAKGYKVVLMTGAPVSPDEYPLPEGCERVIVGRYGVRGVDRLQRIKLTLLRYGIDTVIDHEYYQLEIEREIDAIHALGVRVIVHHHSVFSNMYLRNDRQFALPELLKGYRKADAIITLSDIDETFFRIMGCRACRITDPLPDIPPVFHEGPRGHVILWVARFVAGKRPLDAVRIAEKVLESIPDARLIMLGDGEAKQVAAVRNYLSARPKLASAVSLEGYCSDVLAYAKKADVFLTTTKFDGFSLSILEAKAAALPVISYAMPYLESIRPGTGALTVPQGDIEAAAEAIVGLFGDSDIRETLSRQARVSYEQFSNYDQWAQYESLFASLCTDSARPDLPCDEESVRIILETLFEHIGNSFQMLHTAALQLRGELRDQLGAYASLTKKADAEHAEVLRLRGELGGQRGAYASLTKKADAEHAEVLRLRGELKDQRGAYASLAKKADAEHAEVLRLRRELKDQRGAYASLAKKADAEHAEALRLRGEKAMLSEEVIRQAAELVDCRSRLRTGQRCIEEIKHRNHATEIRLRREIDNLKKSEAYRVGMFVTWPTRRVYRMLKCYRENGLKYTLRRLILGEARG